MERLGRDAKGEVWGGRDVCGRVGGALDVKKKTRMMQQSGGLRRHIHKKMGNEKERKRKGEVRTEEKRLLKKGGQQMTGKKTKLGLMRMKDLFQVRTTKGCLGLSWGNDLSCKDTKGKIRSGVDDGTKERSAGTRLWYLGYRRTQQKLIRKEYKRIEISRLGAKDMSKSPPVTKKKTVGAIDT